MYPTCRVPCCSVVSAPSRYRPFGGETAADACPIVNVLFLLGLGHRRKEDPVELVCILQGLSCGLSFGVVVLLYSSGNPKNLTVFSCGDDVTDGAKTKMSLTRKYSAVSRNQTLLQGPAKTLVKYF